MAAFYKPSLSDDYSQLEEPLYYQFEWECSAVMNNLPNDYRPAVAFKPDGTVFMVRDVLVSGGYKDL